MVIRSGAPPGEAQQERSKEVDPRGGPSPELSVIVPCLDEEDNVTITLDAIANVLRDAAIRNFEIVVCDDASSDETFQRSVEYAERAPELRIRTLRRKAPRRGYGAIVRHGMAHAHGTWCVPVSGDGVDPVDLIPEMLEKARAGADLVQCSRYHRPSDSQTIPFSYKFLQFWWRLLIRLITGDRLPDSTYAFKMVRRVDTLSRGITANGFSIGPEIFFKAYLAGDRIDYILSPQGVRRHGKSKFYFRRELWGFSYVMLRVFFHRAGVLWF
jgi:glycosyltransferase involved in cell wall biosynthesis